MAALAGYGSDATCASSNYVYTNDDTSCTYTGSASNVITIFEYLAREANIAAKSKMLIRLDRRAWMQKSWDLCEKRHAFKIDYKMNYSQRNRRLNPKYNGIMNRKQNRSQKRRMYCQKLRLSWKK